MAEVYSRGGYGRMLADAERLDAYSRALEAAVRPDSVVLDLGTGTGFFAVMAARLGARRVYAVDPSGAIATARQVAADNGVADRIDFIQDVSTRITLPERATVMIADVRGVLPPFQQIAATMADARERLLTPDAVLIPRRDTLLAAPIEAEDAWRDAVGPAEVRSVDVAAARAAAANEWTRGRFRPGQLLAEPRAWAEMDYRTLADPDVCGTAEWTAARAGTAHGLAVWFRADLADGITLESGPGTGTIYQTAFFPWPRPVPLAPGDTVRAEIQARHVAGDYLWVWNSEIATASGDAERFRQSTFSANPPSPAALRRRGAAFVPALGDEGAVDAFVLGRMDGAASLGDIARELRERFPGRFATESAALARAAALAEAYAR